MAGLGRQAVVLTAARFLNYGLTFLAPIILVRLFTVEQFGEYRQFIVYASFLQLVAAFSFTESLLYFIPANAASPWRVVGQTNRLTLYSTVAIAVVLALADIVSGGAVVGPYRWPLVAYVLFFVNFDFWEYFFLATRRPVSVFVYSAGRLTARMVTVVSAAVITHDVNKMIWALVALEGVRLLASAVAWRVLDRRKTEPPLTDAWSSQLHYCVPAGLAMLLTVSNRNLGNVVVAKVLGAVGLAHYTIGTYAEYVYLAIGNSISVILLPEMVRRQAESPGSALRLWQKVAVVNCILLLPVAVLLARFAEPLILIAFGEKYRAAIVVLQIHMLFMIRMCFDFSPAIRAINKTRPLVYSNITALAVNAVLLTLLLAPYGIVGAVTSLVISSFAEAVVLGWFTIHYYSVPVSRFIPWKQGGKVFFAAIVAAAPLFIPLWTGRPGLLHMGLSAVAYYAVFVLLLKILEVHEAAALFQRFRTSVAGALGSRFT
jgi:O-antigen/teichoic acid export membrane protein